MTKQHTSQFGERERQRLVKLLRSLGNNNQHEAETARGMIDRLLREFGKTWADVPQLLSGTRTDIHADVAGAIAAFGSCDPDVVAKARAYLAELLKQHRKSWNDLVDELLSISPAAWVSGPPASELDPVPDLLAA